MACKQDLCKTKDGRIAYARESFMLAMTEKLCDALTCRACTRSQLARRMKKPKRFVDEMLDGQHGFEPLIVAFGTLGFKVHPFVYAI